jgi:NAD(P)-dependent dehydrogenase (short-subunit alcohol dehydrogenase family)
LFDLNNNEELIKDLGDLATFHKCNVASYNDQSVGFQDVWKAHGRLDLVCPNAGILDRRRATPTGLIPRTPLKGLTEL